MDNNKLIINASINILFILIFLTTFFFTYVSHVENRILESQINFLANDITDIIKLFGEKINNITKNYITNCSLPDLSHEDENVSNINNKIIRNALIVNIIFTIFIISLIYFIYNSSKINFSMNKLIIQNIILLVFVALIEYSIVTFYISNFISIDTNKVKYNIVNHIKKMNL